MWTGGGRTSVALAALFASACASFDARRTVPTPPSRVDAQQRIVTPDEVTTEAELVARGERALMEQRWQDAAIAYRTLLAADPSGPHASEYAFDLGLALEGLQERA